MRLTQEELHTQLLESGHEHPQATGIFAAMARVAQSDAQLLLTKCATQKKTVASHYLKSKYDRQSRQNACIVLVEMFKTFSRICPTVNARHPLFDNYYQAYSGALDRKNFGELSSPSRLDPEDPFRMKLVRQYRAAPSWASRHEITKCSIEGDYEFAVARYYIFPDKHGQIAMNSIFGPTARMHSGRNGILMSPAWGDAFEQGAWTIVPHVDDLTNLDEVKHWRASKMKKYRALVIEPKLLTHLRIGKDHDDGTSKADWLNNRKILFSKHRRPRARYFAYHFLYCLSKLTLARSKPTEQLDRILRGRGAEFWPGHYVKPSQLTGFCTFTGLNPSIFEGFVDMGEDDSDIEDEDAESIKKPVAKVESFLMLQTILFDVVLSDRDPLYPENEKPYDEEAETAKAALYEDSDEGSSAHVNKVDSEGEDDKQDYVFVESSKSSRRQ